MPTYDYVCGACHHRFEEFQSIMAEPLKKCPECHRKKLRRLIGPGGGLIFKGSGFYSTDYRSSSYAKAATADNGGSGNSSGDAKGKTSASDGTSTSTSKGKGKGKGKSDSAAKSGGN
jgi:putative FmdB family regulatory protein